MSSRFDNIRNQITKAQPNIIPRALHNISRSHVSENAIKVLYQLKKAGFESYLVGGSVRDLLLGRQPKDFDVVTNALPDQVRKIFKKNCILIGRRFRLAHVRFGGEIIEVATFRAMMDPDDNGDRLLVDGRIVRDNVYGTSLAEDVWRRDFSVNALYYNIADFSVIDYAGGMDDLAVRTLRLIGDPEHRYREDAVRTLRAARFAAKLGFSIHPDTEDPIRELGVLLRDVAPARLFDEVLKIFHGGYALNSFHVLRRYGLFAHLFPEADILLGESEFTPCLRLMEAALANTDARVAERKSVTPAFLFAAFLWGPVQRQADHNRKKRGMAPVPALEAAGSTVMATEMGHVMLPRRFIAVTKEIWTLQLRLAKSMKKHPKHLLRHPRFRAAYDFLVLRAQSGEKEVVEMARWWTDFQEQHPDTPRKEIPERRRRRRRSRN